MRARPSTRASPTRTADRSMRGQNTSVVLSPAVSPPSYDSVSKANPETCRTGHTSGESHARVPSTAATWSDEPGSSAPSSRPSCESPKARPTWREHRETAVLTDSPISSTNTTASSSSGSSQLAAARRPRRTRHVDQCRRTVGSVRCFGRCGERVERAGHPVAVVDRSVGDTGGLGGNRLEEPRALVGEVLSDRASAVDRFELE